MKHEIESDDDAVGVTTAITVSDVHQCKPGLTHKVSSSRIPTIGNSHVLPEDHKAMENLPTCKGMVNGQSITIVRDTGCTSVVVKSSEVKDHQLTGKNINYFVY